MHIYTYAHICIISGRDNETSNFSGTQIVEEETMVMDNRVVDRVCKINVLDQRIHAYVADWVTEGTEWLP